MSSIIAPLTSILKITRLPNKPVFSKNNDTKSAFNRNNDSKSVFGRSNGNGKIGRFGGDGVEYVKKPEKSKGEKLAKSQKLSKSKGEKSKKLSKSGNLPNFDTTEAGSSFLTPNAKTIFKYLWLAFIKVLIFWDFDSKYQYLDWDWFIRLYYWWDAKSIDFWN